MGTENTVSKIYKTFMIITNIVIINLFFNFINAPLLLYLYFISIKKTNVYLFLIFLFILPLTPAIISLFACMYKLIHEQDFFVFRHFFKMNFKYFSKDSLPLFCLIYFLSSIMLLYTLISNSITVAYLLLFYFIFVFFASMMVPFVALEIAIFYHSFFDTIRNGFLLVLMNWKLTGGCILYLSFTYLIFKEFPVSFLFFLNALFGYLFTSMYYPKLKARIKEAKEVHTNAPK